MTYDDQVAEAYERGRTREAELAGLAHEMADLLRASRFVMLMEGVSESVVGHMDPVLARYAEIMGRKDD